MTSRDISKLYHKIGLNQRLRDEVIKEIVESQYKFTKEKINELEFDKHYSEDEFNNIKTNFRYKYIGKIYTNVRLVNNFIKRKNNGRNKHTKDGGR